MEYTLSEHEVIFPIQNGPIFCFAQYLFFLQQSCVICVKTSLANVDPTTLFLLLLSSFLGQIEILYKYIGDYSVFARIYLCRILYVDK